MMTLRVLFLACVAASLGACSHYQLGRPDQEFRGDKIWIEPVDVRVSIAGVALPLNRELREAVIGSASLRLSPTREQADYRLSVSLMERERESIARRSKDTGLSDVLRLELLAEYELIDATGNPVSSGQVSVNGQVFRDQGFNESTRQRLPAMLRDMADDILQACFLNW